MARQLIWLAALVAAPAAAQFLDFSGINADTVAGASDALNCSSERHCTLARSSFGGVPIIRSLVLVNPRTHRVESISIFTDRLLDQMAVDILSKKYGSPTTDFTMRRVSEEGRPYEFRTVRWTGFDEKADVHLTRDDKSVFIDVQWRQNREPRTEPKVDF